MRQFTLALLAVPFVLTPVDAQQIFTNRAAFQAALLSSTTVDFSGVIPPGRGAEALLPGSTINGATFLATAENPIMRVVDPKFDGLFAEWGTGPVLILASSAIQNRRAALSVSFATSNAVGIDYGTYSFDRNVQMPLGNFVLSLGNGVTSAFTYNSIFINTPRVFSFFGIISATPFSSMRLEADNVERAFQPFIRPVYDNLTYGMAQTQNVVPEPSVVWLVGVGVGVLGLMRSKRRG